MSEEMGLEHLASLLAQTYGYITESRVPRLAKHNKNGEKKKDGVMGDFDVVGLGPATHDDHRNLLVIECKGLGAPEAYKGWLTGSILNDIEDIVWSITADTKSVPDERWDVEFRVRAYKPTDCWIVFSGHFTPGKDPALWDNPPKGYELAKKMQIPASTAWKNWEDSKAAQIEKKLLKQAQTCLSKTYGTTVRLFPIHLLIEELFVSISHDMNNRRKRYPSPAAEMIRWMVRAVRNDAMSLEVLEKALKQPF